MDMVDVVQGLQLMPPTDLEGVAPDDSLAVRTGTWVHNWIAKEVWADLRCGAGARATPPLREPAGCLPPATHVPAVEAMANQARAFIGARAAAGWRVVGPEMSMAMEDNPQGVLSAAAAAAAEAGEVGPARRGTGRMDLVMVHRSRRILGVVDWKTGSRAGALVGGDKDQVQRNMRRLKALVEDSTVQVEGVLVYLTGSGCVMIAV